MKKIILSIIIALGIVGVVVAAPEPSIPVINLSDFSQADIIFTRSDIKFATTTDEETGVVTKTGLLIPIKYDFPVPTTTGFVVEEIQEDIGMTFGGYNMCREEKTKTQCLTELNDDIEQTVDAFEQNTKQKLKELKRKGFEDEINLTDI